MDKVFELLINKFATIFNPCKLMLGELFDSGLVSFVKVTDNDNVTITLTKELESDVVDKYVSSITRKDSSFDLWYNSNKNAYNGKCKVSEKTGVDLHPQLTIKGQSSAINDLLDKLNAHSNVLDEELAQDLEKELEDSIKRI